MPTAKGVEWKNFKRVFCHIWREEAEGGDFYAWQDKGERCTDLGNGYWEYDLSDFTFDEDGTYAVIFSNNNGFQTYNLSLTSDCLGDIAVCEGDTCTNPVDSEKNCAVARWLNCGDQVHPVAQTGSDGLFLDPDGIGTDGYDRTWGSSEGVSVKFPEVAAVQAETEQPKDADSANDNSDTDSGEGMQLWLIIVIAVAAAAVVVAVVAVVVKKRKK